MERKLNDTKITRAWTMYDWANSVFSLTVVTAIFPPYYLSVSKAASIAQGNAIDGKYFLDFFGYKIINSALYSYSLSLGFLLVALICPILSGIADVKSNKKAFMKFFCYLGSAACVLMYFFESGTIYFGLLLFVVSLLGFAGSIVFYNAFLPEIASEDQFDKLSARGFSMGYFGSVFLLLANLYFIMNPEIFFPLDKKVQELMAANANLLTADAWVQAKQYYTSLASRICFVSVGLWWAGFAQITFKYVPERAGVTNNYVGNIFVKGFRELKKVFAEINKPQNHIIKRYLSGFFFTSMGVQTVMYVAVIFAGLELKMEGKELIYTVLIIQIIAILGALSFSRISGLIGNIYTLIFMLFVWIGITTSAYFVKTHNEFYILAGVVGIVMGGIQSMCRSTFAKLIPDDTKDTASYFSFYDVTEKIAIVLGTFVYGFINNVTENMRVSVLALIVFFVFALFFIARIRNFKEIHN